MDEIRNAIMEAARGIQKHISGKRRVHEMESRKAISRYVEQISKDLTELTSAKGKDAKEELKKQLMRIVVEKYSLIEKDEPKTEGKKRRKQKRKRMREKKRKLMVNNYCQSLVNIYD